MLTAVLTGPQTIEIRERPLPQPGPGEVRLKVGAVGVCGSDVHYYAHGRIGPTRTRYPTVLGHEPAGVIDAVGEGVTLAPGTRVMIEPADPCGHCEHCLAGRQNICPDVRFLGTPPNEGIFTQYHVMREHCCIPLPEEVSLVEAAVLEPMGVGLHAVALADIRLGETVAVFGAGPIGLVTLLAAKLAGADKVYMTDLLPERLDLARRLGADAVAIADQTDVPSWIRDHTGGRGVDVAFEAAGKQEALTHACLATRIGGRACIIGIPEEDELHFPAHESRRRELTIHNVRRTNGEMVRCLGLVASGRLNVKPLATHFFSLEEVPQALETAHRYRDGVIRAIVQPNTDLRDA